MSVKINIRCCSCGNSYNVFTNTIRKGEGKNLGCPFCLGAMNKDMENQVLEAAFAFTGTLEKFHPANDKESSPFIVTFEADAPVKKNA